MSVEADFGNVSLQNNILLDAGGPDGDADEVVPVEEAYELHGCLPNSKRLTILRGTDHRLSDPVILQSAITEALDWLTEYVS